MWLTERQTITLPRYIWLLGAVMAVFLFAGAIAGCRPAPERPPAVDSIAPADTVPLDTMPAPDAVAEDTVADALERGEADGEVDTLALPQPDGRRQAVPMVGVALSLFNWPDSKWCDGPISGTVLTAMPQYVGPILRSWRACGVRGWINVPRKLLTEDGRVPGRFSATRAKQVAELYRRALSAADYQSYVTGRTLVGFVIMDDVRCLACWRNQKVTPQQVAPMAAEFKRLLPGVPTFVRVTPDWHLEYRGWSTVPGAWAQYNKIRGPVGQYFQEHVNLAARAGSKIVLGVNVNDCYRANVDTPCTAQELTTFFGEAMKHTQGTSPACALSGWKWTSEDWSQRARQEAYASIMTKARALPLRDCRS
jgi:hypothetical protein